MPEQHHPERYGADGSILRSLRVAMDANVSAYAHMLQTSAPGDCWDYLILTAANQRQAERYREELALRRRSVGPAGSFFPAIQKSLVVPDPPGRRAGSGGATLAVLRSLVEQNNLSLPDLARQRILLIHSGGASQRLPAYAPVGKIFSSLPLLRPDGQIATLFDQLYITLAGLPPRLGPGMLVVAGDVLLLFDHRHVQSPMGGVTAFSMTVDASVGSQHGVFVPDVNGNILRTLQKASAEVMQEQGAVTSDGQVLIDTGLLFFDAPRTDVLARMAGCRDADEAVSSLTPTFGLQERFDSPLDLYEDITGALAAATPPEEYIQSSNSPDLRREVWEALHGIPFRVVELDGRFLHLGTTRQSRDVMNGSHPSPEVELLQQNVLAYSEWPLQEGSRVYHSALLALDGATGSLGRGSVVEHSILSGASQVGVGSVVSQFAAFDRPVTLEDNRLLFQVPVRSADASLVFVTIVCGVDDDFKGRFGQGECYYLNDPVDAWFQRQRIAPEDIWPDVDPDDRTLWNARLFVGTADREDFATALALARAEPADERTAAAWRGANRYSMAMILESADPSAIIEQRERIFALLQGSQLIDSIRNDEDQHVESLVSHYSTTAGYEACQQIIGKQADRPAADASSALQQARALWCAAQLMQRPDHPDPSGARLQLQPTIDRAFGKIAEASEMGYGIVHGASTYRNVLLPGTTVTATAPARIDIAGGWSDTPPYCFERGGRVINIAINLDGRPPVRIVVQAIREPKLVIESLDLGERVDLADGRSLIPHPDINSPFAIHRIALQMVGLLPEGPALITEHLHRLGGGLLISTESRVPRGSGLGTSSILAAALLAALHRACGRTISCPELFEQTLILEQRLGAGGGWQDQIGGIIGGVKSIVTKPGLPQLPQVEGLDLSDSQYEAIQDRLVVYYTGQQRLARDILQKVVGRWLSREPAVVHLMEELKRSASALPQALARGRWTEAGQIISNYWLLKRQLFPGSATPHLDLLFLELSDQYLAAGVAGAGGGGFAYFFCKDRRQAAQLRALLAARSTRSGALGSLFNTEINREGLEITVSIEH